MLSEQDVANKQQRASRENEKSRARHGNNFQLDREENSSREKGDGEEGRQLHERRLRRTNTSI
jgi:hypothetical protein